MLASKTFLRAGLLLFVLAIGEAALAQTCPSPATGIVCVPYNNATPQTVDYFSTCKAVTNLHASGKTIMIPVKTSAEWASFYNSPPAGVTAGSCSGFGAFDMVDSGCSHSWGSSCTAGSGTTLSVSGGPRNMYISCDAGFGCEYQKNALAWTAVGSGVTVSFANGDNLNVRSSGADTAVTFYFQDLNSSGALLDTATFSHSCAGGGCP